MYRSATYYNADRPISNRSARASSNKKSFFPVESNIESKYKSRSIPRFTRLYTYNKNKKAAEIDKLYEIAKPKVKHNQGCKQSFLPRAKSSIGSIEIIKSKPRENHILKTSSADGHGSRNSSKSTTPRKVTNNANKKLSQYWQSYDEQRFQKLQKSNNTQSRYGGALKKKRSHADASQFEEDKINRKREKNEFSIIDEMPLQKPKAVVSGSEKDADSDDSCSKYMFISPTRDTARDFSDYDDSDKTVINDKKKRVQSKNSVNMKTQKNSRSSKTLQEDNGRLQSEKSISLKSQKSNQNKKFVQEGEEKSQTKNNDEIVLEKKLKSASKEAKPSSPKNVSNRRSTPSRWEEKPISNRSYRQDGLSRTPTQKQAKSKLHDSEGSKNTRQLLRVRNEKRK